MKDIKLLYVDLFCGAGGTSTGVELATLHGNKCAKVVACVNHDANAIASHKANHPETYHFTEDIRTLDMTPLSEVVKKARMEYPEAKLVLWASLECTNFSKAKGGQPRDADSRTLANHLFRYIEALAPDYIQIENVVEFMAWGEIDENGKPIERLKGTDYVRWCNNVQSYGYTFQWRDLNAADFGAYTSRKRFFGQFVKNGLIGAFPEPTHSKNGYDVDGMFPSHLDKWKAVREVLDLDDNGESIFCRKKPLVEATLKRIYAGLVKFVAGGKEVGYFLSKQFSGDDASKNTSIDAPAGSVTCIDHHALITYYGNGKMHSIKKPSPVVPTHDRIAKVNVQFLANEYSGGGQLGSIETASPSILTKTKATACVGIPNEPSIHFGWRVY